VITFGCLLDESNDMEAHAAAENLRYAWMQWAMYCCEERGGHHWLLSGEHPDDGRNISLHCIVCGANLQDLTGCWDLEELVYGEVGGITVVAGQHNAPDEFETQVDVDVEIYPYTSMDFIGTEYDVTVEIGPVWSREDDVGEVTTAFDHCA
jgi:hypothetical protein